MIGWVTSARAVPVAQVAAELGLTRRHQGWTPCPACSSGRRGSEDRRGPIGLARNGNGWRCYHCQASGSVVDLVGFVLGFGPCSPEVRAWMAARGWCEPAPDRPEPPRVVPRPPPPPEPDQHPDPGEIADLWSRCRPVGDDPEVWAWLLHRGINPAQVEDRDLARALPRSSLPSWVRHWPRHGVRCVFPVYGSAGELVTIRGRVVTLPRPATSTKVWALRDAPPGVLADGTARAVFRGETWPEEAGVRCVFITEGETDWLKRNALLSEDQSSPAILGITGSDAWPEWLSGQIPDGWKVQVDAHLDVAGDRLLDRVKAELADRCPISRSAPRREP